MRVLVACEYSQIVTTAFREKGHEAYSCDIIPTEGRPDWHIKGDVTKILNKKWDLMVAHPPCTYLANSGVRWLHERPERWKDLDRAAYFFRQLMAAPVKRVACENPIPHKYAVEKIGVSYNQIIQPWMFGDNESKAVCLWLKGLPPLIPEITEKPSKLEQRCWKMAPGPERQKERSRFFKGIARAMAEQWGSTMEDML